MNRRAALFYRLYGEPPAKGATRSEVLRWSRRFYTRSLPLLLLCGALIIITGGTGAFVAVGVALLAWAMGRTTLELQIRRAERRER